MLSVYIASSYRANLWAGYYLPKAELGEMVAAVAEPDGEYSASAFPCLLRLPDVRVPVCRSVVAQAASTSGNCFFNNRAGLVGIARDLGRNRIARREDIQAFVAAQREFHRNGLPRADYVEHRQFINRLEKA